MRRVPRVSRLLTTPVKGLRTHCPGRVRIDSPGVPDDRRFYLVDRLGRLVNGRRFGPLVQIVADYDGDMGVLTLCFPDGSTVADRVEVTDQAVRTTFFDHDVTGRVVEGPWAGALSSFSGLELRLVATDRPGTGVDLYPVTVISTASIEFLRRRLGAQHPVDHRHFRMLLEFDGCEPHEEDTWEGALLAIGGVRLRVAGPVPRCAVTRQDPDSGRARVDTLRAIRAYRGRDYAEPDFPGRVVAGAEGIFFGRYCTVEAPGTAALGDEVLVLA